MDVRFVQRSRIASAHMPARAALEIDLVDEHLLHFERVRPATNWMRGASATAVRAVEHDIVVVLNSADIGGPADLGGGDGAAVAEFVVDDFDVAVGEKASWSY